MATTISITPGRTWVTGETVTAVKLNDFLTSATIDSADIVPVGTVNASFATTAPTGYVFLAGKTMGNAASGGTERATADTEDLFKLLWDNLADAQAPVSGGRGASAQDDFDANKTITLPDGRGRVFAGFQTMSGTTTNGLLTTPVDGDVLGDTGGAESVTDTNLPSHTHTGTTVSDGAHTHNYFTHATGGASVGNLGDPTSTLSVTGTIATSSAGAHTHTFTTDSAGAGAGHANVQPSLITTFIIKL